ncbi:glycosyltransferase family 2 protein [Flavitalea flava]
MNKDFRLMETAIKIGALIPTFNRVKSLQNCLQCLKEQDFKGNLVPIVIVDGSTDGTLDMLEKEFPRAVVVKGDGNWWYTKCINEGIKMAILLQCNFVLTLNDDLNFDADYVSILLRDYDRGGPGSVIGSISLSLGLPHIITFSGVSKINYTLKESNYIPKFSILSEAALADLKKETFPGRKKVPLPGLKPSIVLSGRGILYPITIFDQLGLYDENLVQYSSETDFTYRASKNGIPVYISFNAVVYENVQLTSAGAVYNNPSLKTLYKSFKNVYSINSFRKIRYYSIKHRGGLSGNLIALLRTMGVLKNYVQLKLKNKG